MGKARILLNIVFVLIVGAIGCNSGKSATLSAVATPIVTRLSTAMPPTTFPTPATATLMVTTPSPASVTLPATQSSLEETTNEITFQSLNQGDSYTARLEVPALFIAGNIEETNHFSGWLEADTAVRVQGIDFEDSLVVAVFQGKMGSSGYGIAVQKVELTSNTVQIFVNLTKPLPDQKVSDVISYPYHIILLPRPKLHFVPGMTWTISTMEGEILSQSKYP